jgi:hypothetical protein
MMRSVVTKLPFAIVPSVVPLLLAVTPFPGVMMLAVVTVPTRAIVPAGVRVTSVS